MNRLKAILPVAIALVLGTSSAFANMKHDAYVGAGVGVTNSTYTSNVQTSTTLPVDLADKSYLTSADTNFAGTIFAGYAMIWNRWYVGAQVGLSAGQRRTRMRSFNRDPRVVSQDIIDVDTNIKLAAFEFDVDLHPGFYIQQNTLLYGIVGMALNKLRVTSTVHVQNGIAYGTSPFAKSLRKAYLRLGFGFQRNFTKNLSLFFNYIYTNYYGLSVGGHRTCIAGPCSYTHVNNVTAKNKTFLVGVVYHLLNPMVPGGQHNNWSDRFNGFTIGAQGGLSLMVAKAQLDVESDTTGSLIPMASTLEVHPHSTDGIGGLFLGYAHMFHTFYLGAEAGADYADQADRISTFVHDYNNVEELVSDTDVKLGSVSYFFDIKPGLLLTQNTVLYLRLGVGVNQIKTANTTIVDDFVGFPAHGELSLFSKKYETGFRVGLGIEGMITKCLSLRADYVYSYYGTFNDTGSSPFSFGVATLSTTTSLSRITTQTVLVGLAFHFG